VGLIDAGEVDAITTTVTSAGGSLLSNDPAQSVLFEFPPGAVTAPTVVTYTTILPQPTGALAGMDRFFHLEAPPGASFALPVTISVTFPDHHAIKAGTEALYWLDSADWVTSGVTTTGRTSSTLVSLTDHFTMFGVLGETERVYLPLVMK